MKRALEAAAGGCRELGTSMTTLMDLLQILQEYAKTLGYTFTVGHQRWSTTVTVDGIAVRTTPNAAAEWVDTS